MSCHVAWRSEKVPVMLVSPSQVCNTDQLCSCYPVIVQLFNLLYVSYSLQTVPLLTLIPTVDNPDVLNQLIESLPALPPCELVDPADDHMLPRLIEVLERRHRIRQMMSEHFNKTGTDPFPSQQMMVLYIEILLQC